VYYLVVQEKVGRQRIQEHSIREHWRKWYFTAESEIFVNNPTGRNKLVFSSEEPVYYISELKILVVTLKSATLYNLKFLPLDFYAINRN
jgi:hypothetical protein